MARAWSASSADIVGGAAVHEADASVTTEPGIACDRAGRRLHAGAVRGARRSRVGAAHAGWRGLAGGVLEATVDGVCVAAGVRRASCGPGWAPASGPMRSRSVPMCSQAFGVGAAAPAAGSARFVPRGDAQVAGRPARPGPRPARRRRRRLHRRRQLVHGQRAVTVLLVPARRRHRPDGRRRLDRGAEAAAAASGRAPRRRADQVERDRQRQHAVESSVIDRAEPAAAGAESLRERHQDDDIQPCDRHEIHASPRGYQGRCNDNARDGEAAD